MVNKYARKLINLGLPSTAVDTGVLFIGNTVSSFFSFLFTIIIARLLDVESFGIFSAVSNLTLLIVPLTSLGLNYGLIKYVSLARKNKDREKENSYIKATFLIWLLGLLVVSIVLIIFSKDISTRLLATSDSRVSYLAAAISIGIFLWHFFPLVLQAKRKFLRSMISEGVVSLSRTLVMFLLLLVGISTLNKVLSIYVISILVSAVVVGYFVTNYDFLKAKIDKTIIKRLIVFSGWLGVSRISLGVAGRLDVQMLAYMVGATATGFYSISSRLAFYVLMLATSFSTVMATRLSSFEDMAQEKRYIVRTTLVTFLVTLGVLVWIAAARPFIVILFGEKYLPSVNIFRVLALAMIPYFVSTPASTAVTYALKKTRLVGIFSVIQLTLILVLNLILIPTYGVYGPAISIGIVNSLMLLFYWSLVYKYYFTKSLKTQRSS